MAAIFENVEKMNTRILLLNRKNGRHLGRFHRIFFEILEFVLQILLVSGEKLEYDDSQIS